MGQIEKNKGNLKTELNNNGNTKYQNMQDTTKVLEHKMGGHLKARKRSKGQNNVKEKQKLLKQKTYLVVRWTESEEYLKRPL